MEESNQSNGYKIKLEIFEGPLDLLLYLIKKEELDIYDIPIKRITEQYLEYLSLIEMLNLEVAGEFLVMAATLMQIKSKMLLPPDPSGIENPEEDPRAELVRRLLEYKAFKEAADRLRSFEDDRGRYFTRWGVEPEYPEADHPLEVTLFELLNAFGRVLKSLPPETTHEVYKDEFSVAEKIDAIKNQLAKENVIRFSRLFKNAKNKYEVITTFLALLELIRLNDVSVRQEQFFGEIEISRHSRIAGGTIAES